MASPLPYLYLCVAAVHLAGARGEIPWEPHSPRGRHPRAQKSGRGTPHERPRERVKKETSSTVQGPLSQGSKSVPRGRSCPSAGLVTVSFLRRLGLLEEGVLSEPVYLPSPSWKTGRPEKPRTYLLAPCVLLRKTREGRWQEGLPGRNRSGLRVEAEPNALDLCLMSI